MVALRPRGADGGRFDRRGGALGDEPLALLRALVGGGRPGGAAEVAGGRVAVLGVLRERALDDRVERRGRAVLGRLRRRVVQVRPQPRLVALALERDLARERVVQEAAERVDVGAGVDPLAADLLGRDVVERADPVAGLRRARDRERVLGEPEVGQVDVVLGAEQDVRGLDVAMDEAGGVRGVERAADLRDDVRGPCARRAGLRAGRGCGRRRRRRSASRCRRCPCSSPA